MTTPYRAFLSGVKAKKNGFMRVSPFYNEPHADKIFFAAYDGATLEELQIQPEFEGGMAASTETPTMPPSDSND